LRVGHGFDVHRLVPDRALIVGGVNIPFDMGLDGHSDADVLLHAIADALLGAAGLPDIGQHFPPNDDQYKNADSGVLLKRVRQYVNDAGFSVICNVDVTIIAEEPKMAAYIPQMRENIARILDISKSQVGVKATTMEQLGSVGRKEGIAAIAVCLISSDE